MDTDDGNRMMMLYDATAEMGRSIQLCKRKVGAVRVQFEERCMNLATPEELEQLMEDRVPMLMARRADLEDAVNWSGKTFSSSLISQDAFIDIMTDSLLPSETVVRLVAILTDLHCNAMRKELGLCGSGTLNSIRIHRALIWEPSSFELDETVGLQTNTVDSEDGEESEDSQNYTDDVDESDCDGLDVHNLPGKHYALR